RKVFRYRCINLMKNVPPWFEAHSVEESRHVILPQMYPYKNNEPSKSHCALRASNTL
ncbi:6799_t:CDS:2, partial [Funneliformis caledonium]